VVRLTDEQRADRKMLEAQLNSRVMYRARKYMLRVLRMQRATIQGAWRTPATKGFPDLMIVGRSIIFRELKRELGKLDPEQESWRGWLLNTGADWAVWRPSDIRSGRVEAELKAVAFGLTLPAMTDYIDHHEDTTGAAQAQQR
jgi:hypothetical protein